MMLTKKDIRWKPKCAFLNVFGIYDILTLGICGWLKSLSTMTPFTSIVSSSLPPTLPSTLISSKSTSRLSKSATDMIASTAMWAMCSWQRLMLKHTQTLLTNQQQISHFKNKKPCRHYRSSFSITVVKIMCGFCKHLLSFLLILLLYKVSTFCNGFFL